MGLTPPPVPVGPAVGRRIGVALRHVGGSCLTGPVTVYGPVMAGPLSGTMRGMAGNWTDVAAVGISTAALVVAGMAWWQAKRSADAAAHSAGAAERTVEIEAARFSVEHPSVAFAVSSDAGMFRLQNTGRETATAVRVVRMDGHELAAFDELRPQQVSESFPVQATWDTGVITSVLVLCDGVDRSLVVPLTSKPPRPKQAPRRLR